MKTEINISTICLFGVVILVFAILAYIAGYTQGQLDTLRWANDVLMGCGV